MSRAGIAVLTRVLLFSFKVGPFHIVGDTPATVDLARLRAPGKVVLQSVLEMGATE